MPVPIRIRVGEVKVEGALEDADAAQALVGALPLRARFWVWGDVFHFDVPIEHEPQRKGSVDVAVGDFGYWPEGRALCIFFGPTPMSGGERPVAPVPVNVIGSVAGSEALRRAKEAEEIVIEAI